MKCQKKFNIAIIGGSGYVGLITGLGFSILGNKVSAIDIDKNKISLLNKGISPIYEDGVEKLLKESLNKKRIYFTDNYKKGLKNTEIVFIAVGTPSQRNGQADLSQIISSAEQIRDNLNNYAVIVIKSTAPVGTVDVINNILSKTKKPGRDFDIVVNPEFLREGKAIYDFFNPDRIVVGSASLKAKKIIKKVYLPFIADRINLKKIFQSTEVKKKVLYIETSEKAAQMIKYASNSFLAARVSFINEIANISANIWILI